MVTDMVDTPAGNSSFVDSSTNGESQSLNVELSRRVRERADARGLNQTSIAGGLGLSTSTVGTYWHGKRLWPTELLQPLSQLLRCSIPWIVTGLQAPTDATYEAFSPPSDTNDPDEDFVEVQEIDLAYGMGTTFSDGPIGTQMLRFPRSWIEAITSTPPVMLTIARGRGDSMQPTIQDGDMVLIDRSQRTIREQDAIWALTIGDFAMIKRVRAGGERIKILSDNDRVPPDDVYHEEVNVVGRVIFIGRRL
jgi:phage repressor protein C with HTH and peptisase S24 domain